MELIERIKTEIKNDSILYAFRCGSYAWKCSNPHDEDILIITDSSDYYLKAFAQDGKDIFIKSKKQWEKEKYSYYINNALNILFPENVLYTTKEFDFSQSKEEVLNALHNFYLAQKERTLVKEEQGMCWKRMYQGIMLYYAAIGDGSFNFTQEQWDIIQKCHDRELPISYRDELKVNMEKILKEKGLIN